MEEAECLEAHKGNCEGPVEFHATPGRVKAFPRCDKHWDERMEAFRGSIEEEALSPSPPDWFDPSAAGERWDEDY